MSGTAVGSHGVRTASWGRSAGGVSTAKPRTSTCAQPGRAADCFQPPLVPRSGFQQRLTPSVRRLWRGRKNQPSLQTGRSPDAAGRGNRAKRQKPWRDSPPRPPKPKVPEPVKRDVETRAHECMASVRKPKHLAPAPQDTDVHDLVDISTKWSRNSCSFCATYGRPGPSAIAPSFETQCARRESVGDQKFHGSSLRHTGQWWEL